MKWLLSSSVSEGVEKRREREDTRGREADDGQVSLTLILLTLKSHSFRGEYTVFEIILNPHFPSKFVLTEFFKLVTETSFIFVT